MGVAADGGPAIHYEEQGGPAGVPLVLIMGLGGSGAAWWRLLRGLPPAVRAIALDNRGTGRSAPVGGLLQLSDLVGDVLRVLDAAGLERAHVMGTSMGGMVAQHLALDHRDRVASLVLASTTAVGRRGSPPWRLLGAGALQPVLGTARAWPLMAAALYGPATLEDHPERVEEDSAIRAAERMDGRTVLAQLVAVAAHDTAARLGELAGLGVTILHGEQDGLVLPARAHELASAIPGAELVMMPRCGHMLTTDAEAACARAVVAHLERHEPSWPAA